MLHPLYFDVGSRVRLPEAADQLGLGVDEFEVVGCFAGGMGVCLQLYHRGTGQEFGLKSPRPEFVANERALARFLEELRVWLAASASSGVVEALAVFRLNHMPVMISRWLKGGDWTNTMATMSAQSCWVNLLRVVRTLDWAVASIGVAHRDLKPANILLDEECLAYVSDWGLAKPI
jgi:eukaryotic-like serine/threonine-protein kinase